MIYIHKGKCTKLILILIWFGLSHQYNIQDNTGWLLVIVLQVVKRFVRYLSVFTQCSYSRDLFFSWSASRLRDRAIVGYIPTPGQQVSAILWNININVWLQSQIHSLTYCFVLMHDIFTPQNIEHITQSLFCCTRSAVLNYRSFWATSRLPLHFAT